MARSSKMPESFNEEWLYDRLYRAYMEARRGKRDTHDEHVFELNAAKNIEILTRDIMRRTYRPTAGITFISLNPVVREIFAAPFRDRIVHHLIYDLVADWWDKRFIYDSYSCRRGKGTLFGMRRLIHHIRSATNNYKEDAYIIKLDIRGYFMSLDHDLLYKRAIWGLERQFPEHGEIYRILKFLWHEIIFDDPTDGVHIMSPPEYWQRVAATKCLGCQPKGRGIVIGNLTSQLLSNIYMDQFDRFVKYHLGYEHYGRYVDDFFIVVPEYQYEQVKRDIVVMEDFLKSMRLTLHPEKRIYKNSKYGISFLGAMVFPGKNYPDERFRKNFHKALDMYKKHEASMEQIVSYVGHLEYLDGDFFIDELFRDAGIGFPWIELRDFINEGGPGGNANTEPPGKGGA